MTITVEQVIAHARDREYMSGVERDKHRIKITGEVFTNTELVTILLDSLEKQDSNIFKDPTRTFMDPSFGDGQFLTEVLIRKMQNDIDFKTALSTLYGTEFQKDNVLEAHNRLLCGQEELREIVKKNLVETDALDYHWEFGTEKNFDTTPKVVKPVKAKRKETTVDLSMFEKPALQETN